MSLELLGSQGRNPWNDPSYEIVTMEQAQNWVLELIEGVKSKRAECDIRFPNPSQVTKRFQEKAYTNFLIKYGAALGAVMALHRCRKLDDVAYNELRQKIVNLLLPTVVGKVTI